MTTLAEVLAEVSGLVALGSAGSEADLAERVINHIASRLGDATPAEKQAWCAACDRLAAQRWRSAEPFSARERRFYRALPAAVGLRRRRRPAKLSPV